LDYLTTRLISSFFTGVILSQTGSLLQFSTRNTLASPSTLGFDGLSVLWFLLSSSVLLFFNIEGTNLHLMFLGLPFFVLLGFTFLSIFRKSRNIEKLIFLGLTFNLAVGAVFSLWQFFFMAFNLPFPVELWFGHFRFSSFDSVTVLFVFEALVMIFWFYLKKEFSLFSLGPSIAINLGLNIKKLFTYIFLTISIGTFLVISLFGAFSFLGLIFPILARKLWFRRFDLSGEFLVGSAMNGVMLLSIDLACYLFPIYGAEIPVGLIATIVGAVSLIILLWKSDGRWELLSKR
jgi:iron complex transport system permease protein